MNANNDNKAGILITLVMVLACIGISLTSGCATAIAPTTSQSQTIHTAPAPVTATTQHVVR